MFHIASFGHPTRPARLVALRAAEQQREHTPWIAPHALRLVRLHA